MKHPEKSNSVAQGKCLRESSIIAAQDSHLCQKRITGDYGLDRIGEGFIDPLVPLTMSGWLIHVS